MACCRLDPQTKEHAMKQNIHSRTRLIVIAVGSLMAIAVTTLGASAQSSTTSYRYCLLTGPDQECAFNSMAQCMASRHGNQDFCEPNNRYTGSHRSRWTR